MKTIKIRWTRYTGYYWRNREKVISDALLWTPSRGRVKTRRPARIYIRQLCGDTGYSPEDLTKAMWRERVMDIRADIMTWWWWLSFGRPFLRASTRLSERGKSLCILHSCWSPSVTLLPLASVTSTSSNHFDILGRWSTSGSNRGIANFFTATTNTIEGVGEKNKRIKQTIRAWG